MERYCSTGQSPQRAVAPTEEEEEEEDWQSVTDDSRQPAGLIFKDHECCPETSISNNLRCVTS